MREQSPCPLGVARQPLAFHIVALGLGFSGELVCWSPTAAKAQGIRVFGRDVASNKSKKDQYSVLHAPISADAGLQFHRGTIMCRSRDCSSSLKKCADFIDSAKVSADQSEVGSTASLQPHLIHLVTTCQQLHIYLCCLGSYLMTCTGVSCLKFTASGFGLLTLNPQSSLLLPPASDHIVINGRIDSLPCDHVTDPTSKAFEFSVCCELVTRLVHFHVPKCYSCTHLEIQ